MFAQFPFQVDCNANDRYHQGSEDNARHIPGYIQFAHHQQAEYIGDDSQQDRYITFLTFAQFLAVKTIYLAKQENGDGRCQYGEAVNDSQYNQLIHHRHDAQIRKQE